MIAQGWLKGLGTFSASSSLRRAKAFASVQQAHAFICNGQQAGDCGAGRVSALLARLSGLSLIGPEIGDGVRKSAVGEARTITPPERPDFSAYRITRADCPAGLL